MLSRFPERILARFGCESRWFSISVVQKHLHRALETSIPGCASCRLLCSTFGDVKSIQPVGPLPIVRACLPFLAGRLSTLALLNPRTMLLQSLDPLGAAGLLVSITVCRVGQASSWSTELASPTGADVQVTLSIPISLALRLTRCRELPSLHRRLCGCVAP